MEIIGDFELPIQKGKYSIKLSLTAVLISSTYSGTTAVVVSPGVSGSAYR